MSKRWWRRTRNKIANEVFKMKNTTVKQKNHPIEPVQNNGIMYGTSWYFYNPNKPDNEGLEYALHVWMKETEHGQEASITIAKDIYSNYKLMGIQLHNAGGKTIRDIAIQAAHMIIDRNIQNNRQNHHQNNETPTHPIDRWHMIINEITSEVAKMKDITMQLTKFPIDCRPNKLLKVRETTGKAAWALSKTMPGGNCEYMLHVTTTERTTPDTTNHIVHRTAAKIQIEQIKQDANDTLMKMELYNPDETAIISITQQTVHSIINHNI